MMAYAELSAKRHAVLLRGKTDCQVSASSKCRRRRIEK
jgi:hypothetical protein